MTDFNTNTNSIDLLANFDLSNIPYNAVLFNRALSVDGGFNTNNIYFWPIVYLRILASLTFLIMLCCLILFLARLGTWFACAARKY